MHCPQDVAHLLGRGLSWIEGGIILRQCLLYMYSIKAALVIELYNTRKFMHFPL